MRILVHTCCADCLLRVWKSWPKESFEVVGYFYNPNIHPRSEYQSRLAAVRKVARELEIEMIIPDWKPKEFFEATEGNKGRCEKCWKLRVEKTAEQARNKHFDRFSTTLLASKHQDQKKIAYLGKAAGNRLGVKFETPGKMTDESTSGFYKQFFCGCVDSLKERFEEKYYTRD